MQDRRKCLCLDGVSTSVINSNVFWLRSCLEPFGDGTRGALLAKCFTLEHLPACKIYFSSLLVGICKLQLNTVLLLVLGKLL